MVIDRIEELLSQISFKLKKEVHLKVVLVLVIERFLFYLYLILVSSGQIIEDISRLNNLHKITVIDNIISEQYIVASNISLLYLFETVFLLKK
jgi:hypothetical protein